MSVKLHLSQKHAYFRKVIILNIFNIYLNIFFKILFFIVYCFDLFEEVIQCVKEIKKEDKTPLGVLDNSLILFFSIEMVVRRHASHNRCFP